MISSVAKNSWDWSFADFRDFTRGSHLKCFIKKGVTFGWLLLFYNSWWLYTLQLYLASWQLSSSNKSLVGKKNSFIYLMDFTDLGFFSFSFFFYFPLQMPVYLVGYAKGMLYFEQPTVLLARRHLNTMLLTNFEVSKMWFGPNI